MVRVRGGRVEDIMAVIEVIERLSIGLLDIFTSTMVVRNRDSMGRSWIWQKQECGGEEQPECAGVVERRELYEKGN